MKESGTTTQEMEKDMNDIQIIINMRENFFKAKPMEREFILGLMGKFTMANGEEVSKKVMEFGKAS